MAWTLKAQLVFFCQDGPKKIEEIVTALQKDGDPDEEWIRGLIDDCLRVNLLQQTEEGYRTTELGLDRLHRYQAQHSIYGD